MDDLREQILMQISGDGLVRLINTLGFETKKAGREHAIVCPFHDDHKPSMMIRSGKNESGIIKCFACGAGHDIFSFTQDVFGLEGFRKTLEFLAGKLGIAKEVKGQRARVEQREVVRNTAAAQMTPSEVYEVYKHLREHREEITRVAGELGVRPDALEMAGMFAVSCGRNPDTGCFEAGRGGRCLIAPMRNPLGELVSLRFRSMGNRAPGEGARRWSLDQSVAGDKDTQLKCTISGLIAPQAFFDDPPGPDQLTIVNEGESDHAAGLSMMLDDFGTDVKAWPARWFGLPGVNSCHEMLVPEIVGSRLVTFMDSDAAGRGAVFDRKPWVCENCGMGMSRPEPCRKKVGEGKCGGRAMIDVGGAIVPGLLSKVAAHKITGMAAFPPAAEQDQRDLYKSGWRWEQLYNHILATATRAKRERA